MTIRRTSRGGRAVLVIDIVYRRPDGRKGRYRKDARVQTMTAAREEERALVQELGERKTLEPLVVAPKSTNSFDDAVKVFRAFFLPSKKPSTAKGYDEIVTGVLVPKLGPKLLESIGKAELAKIDASLATTEVSPSRRRNVHVVFRSVLKTAVVHGLLATFPELPNLPKVGRVVTRPLTRAQVLAILKVANPTARIAFALAAFAGLRRGEVRGLRWSDVDLKAQTITVRRSITKGRETTPKSGHQRVIPIGATLLGLLRAAPKPATPWSPVAPNEAGRIWGEVTLLRNFQRACKRASVSTTRFHALRHYFVSELFRRGAGARAVQELAGHIHLGTTQGYAAVGEKDRRAAIAKLG